MKVRGGQPKKMPFCIFIMKSCIVVCFIYFIIGVYADSVLVKSCAPALCPAGEKFSYGPGYSYIYNYEVNIATTISGATKDFTSIYIEAQAEIHAISECELTLKLRNVNLRSRDVDNPAPSSFASGHQQFKEALEKWALHFSFEDGAIETLCADPAEEPWVLNIKRAIVSTLQNRANINSVTSTQTVERDIQGSCPTEYTLDYVWTNLTAKKTKDLDKCKERNVFLSAIQSSPYLSLKTGRLNAALQSSYKCEQDIVDEVMQRVSCDERHILRPFSNGDGGAMTMTKQTLVLIDELHRPVTYKGSAKMLKKTTLLFDHDYATNRESRADDPKSEHDAEMALYRLCDQSRDDTRTDTPLHFWQLVNALKRLGYPKLKEVLNSADRICDFSPRGMKFFLDALPMIGSPISVALMKDLILNGSVPKSTENSWLEMTAFHPQPTPEILNAIMPLLKSAHPSPKALLSVSALANSYCQTITNCGTNNEVQELIRIIERQLGIDCNSQNTVDTERIIVALKALGNLGIWTSSRSKLQNCIARKNPTVVRLTAMEAYRRLSCDVSRDHLLRVFLSDKEDSEIRIAAYVGAMKCPSYGIINDIWKSLHHESVNQVNTFVWSHLSTIQKSVDPGKIQLRTILEDVELQQKYNQDVRKFSRAFEKSAFSEILNVGANLETHLIYSPMSFIPRSAMLNLTVDLFGQSINLVELNGRIEGLDHVAESLFRPVPHSAEIKINPEDSGKPKSPAKDTRIQQLSQKVKAQMPTLSSLQPDAIFSMKIFGQEVWYNHMKKDEIESTIHQWLQYSYEDFLGYLSLDNALEFTRDSILMDTTYMTPTLAGLPLILALNSTASVHLKMGGRMDVRRLSSGICDVEGQVRPSAAISVVGTMTVDGYVGKSGVKINASLHTSTVFDGKVQVTDEKRVKVHFNLPREKLDFVQVRTNLYLNHWGRERPLRSNPVDRTDVLSCSTAMTSKLLGVEFCSEFRYPNASQRPQSPSYPLTGPTRIGLWLQKTDPTLTSYHFEYHLEKGLRETSSSRGPRSFLLSFHTPHSSEDREWTVDYADNPTDKSLHLRLATPYKKVLMKGHYNYDVTRKGLYADVSVDGKEEFSFQAEVRATVQGDSVQYLPRVIIRVPTHQVMSLEGNIRYNKSSFIKVDVTIENVTVKSIIFRGELTKLAEDNNNIHYSSVFNSPILDATVKGSLNKTHGGLVSKTHLEYQLADAPQKETVDLTMKMRYISPPSRSLTTATAVIDIHTSIAPEYNSIVNWNFQLADGHIENTIVVDSTGNGRKAQVARVQQILQYEGTLEDHKVKSKFEVKVPSRDVHTALTVDHQNKLQMLSSKVFLKSAVDREYGIEVEIRDDSTYLWQVSGLTLVHWNGAANGISVNITENVVRQYVAHVSSHGRPFGNSNATLHYKNNSTDIYFDQAIQVKMTGDAELTAKGSLFVMEDRGNVKLDAESYGHTYQLEGTYKQLRAQEYESQFAVVCPWHRFDGTAKFNVGEEKALSVDCRSSSGRRIVGNARMKYLFDVKDGGLYLAWDADRDASRQFNVSVLDERHLDLSHKYVYVVYLDRALGLELDHRQQGSPNEAYFLQKTHVLVDWAAAKKLGVDLDLKLNAVFAGKREVVGTLDVLTPLSALETVVVDVTHNDDGLSWKSDGTVRINRRLPFRAVSQGKYWRSGNQQYVDSSTNVTTSIDGFEQIGVNFEHNLASREIKTNARVHWSPADSINIQVYGVVPKSKYDKATVNLNVTTPFAAFYQLGFVVDHGLKPDHVNSLMRLLWNDEQQFYVSLNGDTKRDGHRYEVLGNVVVVTPLDGFDNFTVQITHLHDMYGFNSHLRGLLPSKNVLSAQGSGHFKRTAQFVLLDGNFDVSSRVVNFGTGVMYERKGSEFKNNIRGNWNTTFANFSSRGAYAALTDFELNSSLSTSLEGLRDTNLVARNRIDGKSIVMQLLGKVGTTEGGLDLKGRWDFYSSACRSLDVGFSMDSPVSALPHVTFNATHGCQGFEYCTRVRGTWDALQMSLNHTLSLRDGFNFEDTLAFGFPYDNLRHVHLAVNQSRSPGFFKNDVQLQVDHGKLMGTSVDFRKSTTDGRRKIDAVLKLDSSIWNPHRMEIVVDHDDDGQEYRPKVTIQTTEPSSKVLQLIGHLKSFSGSKVWRLTANTQIPHYETVEMGGMYSVSDTALAFNLSTRWSQSGLSVDGEIGIDILAPRLRLDIVTPKDGYRTFKLDGGYNVWTPEKHAAFFVQKETWKLNVAGRGTFEGDAMSGGLVVETPSSLIGTIHLNVSASWNPASTRGFKTVLSWDSKKTIAISIGLQPYRNRMTTITTSVVTPLQWVRNVDSIVKISRDADSRLTMETSTRWNRANMVDVTVGLLQSATVPLDVSVTVRSTTPAVPQTSALLRVESGANHRTWKFEALNGDRKLKVDVQVRFRGKRTEVAVDVETPFRQFPKGSLSGNFRQKGRSTDVDVTLGLPFSGMETTTLTGTLNAIQGVSRGSLTVGTSTVTVDLVSNGTGMVIGVVANPVVTTLEMSELKFEYNTHFTETSVSGSLVDKSGRHDVSVRMTGPASDVHVKGRVVSPLLKDKTPLDAEIWLRVGHPLDVYCNAIVKEAGVIKHSLQLNVTVHEPGSASLHFFGATPLFSEGKGYGFGVDVADTAKGLEASMVVSLPSGKYFGVSEYERDSTTGLVSVLLDAGSPLKELNRLKVHARKTGREWDNVALSMDILTPIEGYDKFSTAIATKHTLEEFFDFRVYMDTPFEGYEEIAFEETLEYNFKVATFESDGNFTFDGVTTSFAAWYVRTGESVDVGADARWRPATSRNGGQAKSGSAGRIGGKFGCQTDMTAAKRRYCLVEVAFKGTPWEGEGAWNYTSWRSFRGDVFVDTLSVGFGAKNDMPIGGRTLDSQLTLHWAGRRVADVLVRGAALQDGKRQGSINITTPFSLVRQVDGRGSVLRDENGISGNVDVDVNGQTLIEGAVELVLQESDGWRNKTVRVDLENPWQPFGLFVLSCGDSNVLTVDSSLAWNLAERDTHSLKSTLQVSYNSFGRAAHLTVVHPKHQIDLVTHYQKLPSNFSHATTLRLGAAKSTLVAYQVWLRSDSGGKPGGDIRKNGGFRWEHPGRVVLCVADVVRKTRFYQTALDLKWDASRSEDKRIRLNMDYEDASNQLAKTHKVKMVLRHSRLTRDVEMNSAISLGHGKDLLKGTLTVEYSPNQQEKLNVNVDVRRSIPSDDRQGFELDVTAKHAGSNLDLQLSSDWMKSTELLTTNTTLSYLNKDGRHIRLALEGLGDLINENAVLLVRNSEHSTKFTLAMHHPEPNNYTVILTKNIDERPHYISKVFYQPNSPYMEANATSTKGVDDYFRFSGGLQTMKRYTLQILHGDNGKEVRDISAVLNLNTTHFLTARVYWVSDIIDQVREAVGQYLSNTHNQTMTSLWQIWDFSLMETADKFQLGWGSFAHAVQPMFNELKYEIHVFIDDFIQVRDYLATMYKDNDLLFQDIVMLLEKGHNYFKAWYLMVSEPFNWNFDDITDYVADSIETLRNVWNSVLDSWNSLSNSWILQIWNGFLKTIVLASDLMTEIWERVGGALSSLPTAITNMMTNLNSSSNEMMNHFSKLLAVGENIKAFWGKIYAMIDGIKTWIKEKVIDAFINWIFGSEIYIFLRTQLIQAFDGFVNLIRYQLLDLIAKWINVVKLYMLDKQKKIADSILTNLYNIRDVVWAFVPNIVGHPVVRNSLEAIKAVHSKVMWVLQYYELTPEGYMTVFKLYNYWMEMFTLTAEESSERFDSSNYVIFTTENGLIEMDQQLPFPWKSLKEAPQIQEMKEIKTFYELWKTFNTYSTPVPYNSYGPPFMSWYNELQQKFDYRTWFPPFEGQAIFAGRQHYVTFDGQVIEFAGACSYLLTHDFMDGNFTATVNYETHVRGRSAKRSISLWMDGKEIDILPNFQVFVDGKKVELPHSFGETTILREADKTVVKNGYGITATCHWTYDVCTFKVSGWYFGRLAGLFGAYNYEPVDDIVNPDGIASKGQLGTWGSSWAVDQARSCRIKENLAVEAPRKDPIADQLCLDLFNNTFSVFKYCYEKVDPRPFLNMCLSDIQTRDTPEDVCTSAAVYVQTCHAVEILLRIPKICVKCHLPNGRVLNEAGNMTMNSTVKTADTVFIIEAKKCNRDITAIFHDLVHNIDSAMNSAVISERRYATVVFGGSGVYDAPHVLTSDSKIFTNHRTMSPLNNFKVGRGTHDFFDALRFAAKLPFHPGASKNFVVLTCSIGESVAMRIDYPEVHRMLLEDGIIVHLLLDREFEIKRPELLLYGIDGVNAYTSKDSRSTTFSFGDPDLRRQVMPPKDICVPIVLESNGTVFSSLRLNDTKKMVKSFLDVYSRRIAQSAEMPVCQTCDCFPNDSGVGRIYCQPCVFPRPAHFYIDPNNFYEAEYTSIYHKTRDSEEDENDDYDEFSKQEWKISNRKIPARFN